MHYSYLSAHPPVHHPMNPGSFFPLTVSHRCLLPCNWQQGSPFAAILNWIKCILSQCPWKLIKNRFKYKHLKARGQGARALDWRPKCLGFDSNCWSCIEASSNLTFNTVSFHPTVMDSWWNIKNYIVVIGSTSCICGKGTEINQGDYKQERVSKPGVQLDIPLTSGLCHHICRTVFLEASTWEMDSLTWVEWIYKVFFLPIKGLYRKFSVWDQCFTLEKSISKILLDIGSPALSHVFIYTDARNNLLDTNT